MSCDGIFFFLSFKKGFKESFYLFLLKKNQNFLAFLFKESNSNFLFCSFSGAENEPRDIHPLQTSPYMGRLNRSSCRSFIKVSSDRQRSGLENRHTADFQDFNGRIDYRRDWLVIFNENLHTADFQDFNDRSTIVGLA